MVLPTHGEGAAGSVGGQELVGIELGFGLVSGKERALSFPVMGFISRNGAEIRVDKPRPINPYEITVTLPSRFLLVLETSSPKAELHL
jgi:hypothetical protein